MDPGAKITTHRRLNTVTTDPTTNQQELNNISARSEQLGMDPGATVMRVLCALCSSLSLSWASLTGERATRQISCSYQEATGQLPCSYHAATMQHHAAPIRD
jgi:hypothetical protein